MQTFIPYEDFARSAKTLDNKRLGKQRVETLQIMTCLTGGLTASGRTYSGWVNHPAVKMWRGYEETLMQYQDAICSEWVDVRGYRDTCRDKTETVWLTAAAPGLGETPPWLGNEALHESHRSNLIRKDPAYYAGLVFDTRLDLDYVWPVA